MMPIVMGQFEVNFIPSQLIYKFPNGKEIWAPAKIEIIEWAYCRFDTNYQPKVVKEMEWITPH